MPVGFGKRLRHSFEHEDSLAQDPWYPERIEVSKFRDPGVNNNIAHNRNRMHSRQQQTKSCSYNRQAEVVSETHY